MRGNGLFRTSTGAQPTYQDVNETTSSCTKAALKNKFFREYDFDALYRRLIQDYTGRDLKYDEDALNAILASTAECERSGHSLMWALPTQGLARH